MIQYRDCTIDCGARPVDDELAAIASGHSKLTDPYESKHVIGPNRPLAEAVDVLPYPVLWPDQAKTLPEAMYAYARFYEFAGFVRARAIALGVKIRWGGAWDGQINRPGSFNDLPHFEVAA